MEKRVYISLMIKYKEKFCRYDFLFTLAFVSECYKFSQKYCFFFFVPLLGKESVWQCLLKLFCSLVFTLFFLLVFSVEEEPILLFSNRYYVRQITTDGNQYDLIASGFSLALSLDYDLQDQKVYIIDIGKGLLTKMNFDGSDQEVILSDFITGSEGLALDWVGR